MSVTSSFRRRLHEDYEFEPTRVAQSGKLTATKPSALDKNYRDTIAPSRSRLNLSDSGHLPTEPPVESWQNSNSPSNTGQSSPTLTVEGKFH